MYSDNRSRKNGSLLTLYKLKMFISNYNMLQPAGLCEPRGCPQNLSRPPRRRIRGGADRAAELPHRGMAG